MALVSWAVKGGNAKQQLTFGVDGETQLRAISGLGVSPSIRPSSECSVKSLPLSGPQWSHLKNGAKNPGLASLRRVILQIQGGQGRARATQKPGLPLSHTWAGLGWALHSELTQIKSRSLP